LGENEPLSKRPHITINTLYDVLLYGARVYPASKHLFGTRSVTNIVKESKDVTKSVNGVSITKKKEWSFFELSAYKWVTYRDAVSITTNVGAGLVKIGLKPQDKVTIFASTK
jgi:long-chain acyl-CoA synthetase